MEIDEITCKIIGYAMKLHNALEMVFKKLFINGAWQLNWKR